EASLGAAEAFANDVVVKRDVITEAGGEFLEMTEEAIAELQADADAYVETWIEAKTTDGFDAAAYLADAKAFAESYK
ncbi:MAG: hypothetical protein IJJ17_02940, partial [Parasporobacterium sp.]|nr:hypothetical protein [Parasporobacterium sp.]